MSNEDPRLDIEIDSDRRETPPTREPAPPGRAKGFFRRSILLGTLGLTLGLSLVALGLWQADQIANRFVPDLQAWLRAATGMDVSIGRIETGWRRFRPELRVFEVKVGGGAEEPAATAARLEFELDLSQSLVSLTPRFGRVEAHALRIEAKTASKPSGPVSAQDLVQALGTHLATRFELVLTDAQWKENARFDLKVSHARAVTHLSNAGWEGDLTIEKASVDAPSLWLRPLEIESLKTALSLSGLQAAPPKLILSLDPAVAKIPGTRLRFGLRSEWPDDLSNLPRLDLSLETDEAQLSTIRGLLPTALFGSELKLWIDTAIQKGETDGAILRLSGPAQDWATRGIEAFKDPAVSKLEVELPFTGATVDYRDDWPRLEEAKGKFIFRQTDLSVEIASAQTIHGLLRDGRVDLSKLHEGNPLLKASGEIQSTAEQMTALLTDGLLSGLKPFMEKAQPTGSWVARFDSTMPLEKGDWRVELDLKSGGFKLVQQPVQILDLSAHLQITPQNLGIQGGKGRWGERILEWSAQSNAHSSEKKRSTQLTLSGAFEVTRLREAMPELALPSFAEGGSLWKIESTLLHGEVSQLTVEGHSTLVGSKINLPPPLKKDSEEEWPLSVRTRWTEGKLREARGVLSGAGNEIELEYRPPLVKAQFKTQAIDLEAWNTWTQNVPTAGTSSASGESEGPLLGVLRLSTPEIKWKTHRFTQADIQLDAAESAFTLTVQARGLAGKIESSRPWKQGKVKIELSQLHLAEWPFEWPPKASTETAPAPVPSEEPPPPAWDMREWPSLALKIDGLRIGDEAFGELRFKASRSENGFTVDFGRWTTPQFEWILKAGETTFGEEPGKGTTRAEVELKLTKFNRPTPFMRSAEAFSASDGKVQLKANWPGTPNQFRLSSTTGEASAYLASGKWVGVRSFIQTLFNTLSFNFEDARKKVMRFSKLSLEIGISPGKIGVREARALFGSVFARIEGTMSTPAQELQMEAMIAPQVADVDEDEVSFTPEEGPGGTTRRKNPKTVFTHRYSVKGTWEQPQISLKAPGT